MTARPAGTTFGNLDVQVTARPKLCGECGAKHYPRWRRPGWCIECDIRDRLASGVSPEKVAIALDLPVFLVEALA